jgi:hypothetical protein
VKPQQIENTGTGFASIGRKNIQHTFDADLLDGHRMVLLASQTETNHKEREMMI